MSSDELPLIVLEDSAGEIIEDFKTKIIKKLTDLTLFVCILLIVFSPMPGGTNDMEIIFLQTSQKLTEVDSELGGRGPDDAKIRHVEIAAVPAVSLRVLHLLQMADYHLGNRYSTEHRSYFEHGSGLPPRFLAAAGCRRGRNFLQLKKCSFCLLLPV